MIRNIIPVEVEEEHPDKYKVVVYLEQYNNNGFYCVVTVNGIILLIYVKFVSNICNQHIYVCVCMYICIGVPE